MGIGQLYKSVLEKLGYEVITVDSDSSKNADFSNIDSAIMQHDHFVTAHICTPNFTHFELASKIAPYAKIVFIEKPGVEFSVQWQTLCSNYPSTRFMMVKNNMWRSNIRDLNTKAQQAKTVNIEWIRRNCIPSPGSWFTNRKLAFGGVSRDLMPHLLSLYIALNDNWRHEKKSSYAALQHWLLEDIESTEYGTVYPSGTYDVDDECSISFGHKWNARANWRSMTGERSAITFINQDNTQDVFELGWCPEDAYENMIKDSVENLNNDEFWKNQLETDLWIHRMIENL